jgi:hypothetical protein
MAAIPWPPFSFPGAEKMPAPEGAGTLADDQYDQKMYWKRAA